MANKLYVGNLSYSTTENDLSVAFAQVGTVKHVTLIQDRATGQSRGFGFVTMSTDEEAAEAVRTMHGTDVGGRRITVTEARPREDRPPGQGGGGGGGGAPRQYSGPGGGDRGGFQPRRPMGDSAGGPPRPGGAAPGGGPQRPPMERRTFDGPPRPASTGGPAAPQNPAQKFQDSPPRLPAKQKDWEAKKPKSPGRPKPKDDGDDEFDEIDYRWKR